jgi:hypothetical protein
VTKTHTHTRTGPSLDQEIPRTFDFKADCPYTHHEGTQGETMNSSTPLDLSFTIGKEARYPLKKRLYRRRKISSLTEIRTPGRLAHSSVVIQTELSLLLAICYLKDSQ